MSKYTTVFMASASAFIGSVIGFIAGALIAGTIAVVGYHTYIVKNSSCFGNACHYVHDKRVIIDERKL